MSVIQRCPSCGTTQNTPGECEACHESRVRFYCTNHTPGLWLEGRACPACDARRAGATEPPPVHRAPTAARHVPTPAPARSPAAASRRPRPAPAEAPPVWREPEVRGPGDEPRGDDLAGPPARMALDPGPSREPGWMSVLRGVMPARSAVSAVVPAVRSLRLIGALVKRVLLVGVVLLVMAALALYLLIRDML